MCIVMIHILMQATHFRFIHCVERFTLQNKHGEWEKCFEMSGLGFQPIDCYNSGYGGMVISLIIIFAYLSIYATFFFSPLFCIYKAWLLLIFHLDSQLENKYAKETSQLNPPHRFVPWVVVNNQPLQEVSPSLILDGFSLLFYFFFCSPSQNSNFSVILQDFENFMAYICKAYKGNPKPEACRSLSYQNYSTENFIGNSNSAICYVGERRNFTSLNLAEKIPR